jgi:hypothetical protein
MMLCCCRACTNFTTKQISWVHLIREKYYSNGRLPNHTKKGSFWWRDNLKLLDSYKGLAAVIVGKWDTS